MSLSNPTETGRGTERIEAFNNGAFAAATRLVSADPIPSRLSQILGLMMYKTSPFTRTSWRVGERRIDGQRLLEPGDGAALPRHAHRRVERHARARLPPSPSWLPARERRQGNTSSGGLISISPDRPNVQC